MVKTWWSKEDDIDFVRTVWLGFDFLYERVAADCQVSLDEYIENRMMKIFDESGLTLDEFGKTYWNNWDGLTEFKEALVKKANRGTN